MVNYKWKRLRSEYELKIQLKKFLTLFLWKIKKIIKILIIFFIKIFLTEFLTNISKRLWHILNIQILQTLTGSDFHGCFQNNFNASQMTMTPSHCFNEDKTNVSMLFLINPWSFSSFINWVHLSLVFLVTWLKAEAAWSFLLEGTCRDLCTWFHIFFS